MEDTLMECTELQAGPQTHLKTLWVNPFHRVWELFKICSNCFGMMYTNIVVIDRFRKEVIAS